MDGKEQPHEGLGKVPSRLGEIAKCKGYLHCGRRVSVSEMEGIGRQYPR